MRGRALAGLAPLLLLACGSAPEEGPRRAPVTVSRASWVLEPPELALGEVGELELAVVTPPGHHPRPWRAPEAPPGLWVLDSETGEVRKEDARWIHRTRVRVRARDVGALVWPGTTLAVDTPEGEVERVEVEPLAIEVRSALDAHAGRTTPYGVRTIAAARVGEGSLVAAFAAGVALALAGVGLLALARRRRAAASAQAPAAETAPPQPPAWEVAREAVADAGRDLERDPVAALDALARALRRYASARFRADLAGRTTEELEAIPPPFLLTTRWPALIALLRDLDAARFPPPRDPAALRARGAELVRVAETFVAQTVPREAVPHEAR